MLTFIRFLEDLERSNQTVVVEASEVERLVNRFGPKVRSMGAWNRTTDGSVEVPVSNITEAAKILESKTLAEAVRQLKSPEQCAGVLNSSSAAGQFIDALSKLYLQKFQRKVERYQDSDDPAEAERLRQEISRELFGE